MADPDELTELMDAYQALEWLASLPPGVTFAYLGPHPGWGGYACLLYVGKKPWWQGGGPKQIIEGLSDGMEDHPNPLDAIKSARRKLEDALRDQRVEEYVRTKG